MKTILSYIKQQLEALNINYAYLRWNADIVDPYFIGECTELEPTEEDQYHEYDFILTGFTRKTWSDLDDIKTKIEKLFSTHTTILDNGSGVVISYTGSFPIPIDEEELKKIQINLNIKEWRVN